jgi:phage terminase large subunit-like protein
MTQANSSASYFLSLPETVRRERLSRLTPTELYHLKYEWSFWARDKQRLPQEDFFTWLILAGRGFGKTRTGAETVREWKNDFRFVNLIGATADDARDIMIEGESGILAVCPVEERPRYVPSKRRLEWKNGATSLIFTADEPERLRGKQHMKLWCDELAAWRYPESWDQAMFGLRLGKKPQAVVTTTPRPIKIITDLIADERNITTIGTTYENSANLARDFFRKVITRYEGTRLGRQELLAEILDDTPGALWKRKNIEDARVIKAPILDRIVVAVDPTASTGGDEAGIITKGRTGEDYYVIADDSTHGSPQQWAKAAVTAYHRFRADVLVAEKNNGGEMVAAVILQVDPTVNVKLVWASRGKATRAEPVSAISEQGRDHHVGVFPKLEDELCTWVPGDDSPNRLDADVWATTELMEHGKVDVSDLGKVTDFRNNWE